MAVVVVAIVKHLNCGIMAQECLGKLQPDFVKVPNPSRRRDGEAEAATGPGGPTNQIMLRRIYSTWYRNIRAG